MHTYIHTLANKKSTFSYMVVFKKTLHHLEFTRKRVSVKRFLCNLISSLNRIQKLSNLALID